jgi:hypothetical protein
MFLPSRKVIYDVHTTFSGTMLILFVEAFMKIMKLTFSKQISLHNWILIAFFLLFGINVIFPMLRLKEVVLSYKNSYHDLYTRCWNKRLKKTSSQCKIYHGKQVAVHFFTKNH